MSLSAEAIHRLLNSRPVQSLTGGVRGARNWMGAMQALSSGLGALSREDDLVPDIEVNIILDPLYGSVLGWLSESGARDLLSVASRNVPGADDNGGVNALPQTRKRWRRREDVTKEDEHQFLMKAREISDQPGRLLAILQRYAGLLSLEHPAAQTHPASSGTRESPSFKIKASGVAETTPQGRKTVSLPISRTEASASGGKGLPSSTSNTSPLYKFEERAGKKLKQWVKDENVGIDLISKLAFREISMIGGSSSEETLDTAKGPADKSLPIKIARSVGSLMKGGRAWFGYPGILKGRGPAQYGNTGGNDRFDSLRKPASFDVAGMNRQGPLEREGDVRAGKGRLEEAVQAAWSLFAGSAEKSNYRDHETSPVIQSLERIVEQLMRIETRFPEAREEEPKVQWLEDEDLAGRLQKILRGQARRRGIDLS